MFRFITLSALFVAAFAAPSSLDGRILGGWPGYIRDFPYLISVQYYGQHICGGSIISPRHIITAAHCTNGMSASAINIRAGSTYHASGGFTVLVSAIKQHPSYNPSTQDNDISILILANDLEYYQNVKPVKLPADFEVVEAGKEAVCSGWGIFHAGILPPANLMFANFQTITKELCELYYKGIATVTESMICTLQPAIHACQGDSGGPLVLDGKLIGVVSWRINCTHPNYPDVYADVGYLRRFIRANTGV